MPLARSAVVEQLVLVVDGEVAEVAGLTGSCIARCLEARRSRSRPARRRRPPPSSSLSSSPSSSSGSAGASRVPDDERFDGDLPPLTVSSIAAADEAGELERRRHALLHEDWMRRPELARGRRRRRPRALRRPSAPRWCRCERCRPRAEREVIVNSRPGGSWPLSSGAFATVPLTAVDRRARDSASGFFILVVVALGFAVFLVSVFLFLVLFVRLLLPRLLVALGAHGARRRRAAARDQHAGLSS